MRKEIGQVSAEERDEIQRLFERRNGLSELAKILTSADEELYEKLVKEHGRDLGEVSELVGPHGRQIRMGEPSGRSLGDRFRQL